MYYTDNEFRLYHHGVLGQKWGVRRYQNADGSLTAAGRKRKIESQGSRIRRSIKGAKLENKIDKLERKNYSDKRQEKINRLKELRDMKLSDLSDNEIKYGKMYMDEYTRQARVITVGTIVAGVPGGVLASAGYSAARRLTKSGKEFNEEFDETAKAVRQENKERIKKEKNKIEAEQEMHERSKNYLKRMGEADDFAEKRYRELLSNGETDHSARIKVRKEIASKYSDIYKDGSDFDDDILNGVNTKLYQKGSSAELKAYEKDVEKANSAKTDEEHDKLLRAADVNNINRRKNSSAEADVRMEKYYSDTKKYFSENKSKLLSNAKKNDRYDLEFLEITQNDYDDMSDSERNSKRIRDYEKYLDDPEGFTRKHYGR